MKQFEEINIRVDAAFALKPAGKKKEMLQLSVDNKLEEMIVRKSFEESGSSANVLATVTIQLEQWLVSLPRTHSLSATGRFSSEREMSTSTLDKSPSAETQ